MVFSKRVGWFLVAFGGWSWFIWPTFLKNIWNDKRSWNHGMTTFFAVHLVLTVVSLTLGTIIGVLGIRALRALRRRPVDRVWQGPAPRGPERETASADAVVVDPYDA